MAAIIKIKIMIVNLKSLFIEIITVAKIEIIDNFKYLDFTMVRIKPKKFERVLIIIIKLRIFKMEDKIIKLGFIIIECLGCSCYFQK